MKKTICLIIGLLVISSVLATLYMETEYAEINFQQQQGRGMLNIREDSMAFKFRSLQYKVTALSNLTEMPLGEYTLYEGNGKAVFNDVEEDALINIMVANDTAELHIFTENNLAYFKMKEGRLYELNYTAIRR